MTRPVTRQAVNPANSEKYTIYYDHSYRMDASRRLVEWFPGGQGNNRSFIDDTAQGRQVASALVGVGYPLGSADHGGGGQWGNDLSQTRIGQNITICQSDLNTKTDKVIGIGASQGVVALLNYEYNHPGTFAAIVGFVSALPVDKIHDEDRGPGLQASINSAYGSSAAWESAKATHDPSLHPADWAGLPIRLYYATDDPVSTEAEQLAFAAGVGPSCSTVSLGNVGHSGDTVDPDDVLRFLEPYLA